MIIKSIRIKEGFTEKTFNLSCGVNLIFSKANSKGKTTLLRFILYSLGYNIPNTRKIRFDRCEVTTALDCEKKGEIVLSRFSLDHIVAAIDGVKTTYVLPDQLNVLHSIIFCTSNSDILNNMLGAFYADQEKGWTLLNRGTAIGSIHFNIEELIRGLSGIDCSGLIRKEAQLTRELSKYRQMFSVAKYRESVIKESGALAFNDYSIESDAAEAQLLMRQKALQAELRRIDKTLSDNKHFRRFIAEMKLMVEGPNGETIYVTEDNIIGLEDIIDFLIAKRKMVSSDLFSVNRQLMLLQKEQENEEQQLAFFESENLIEIFDKKIASVPINVAAIEKEISRLEKTIKALRQEISKKTKSDSRVIGSLYENMVKYATELGVGNSKSIASSYLFTSNLKELSGAVLHKTVFAFRLAYIIEIEKTLGIKLPIILDSPSGKEVDNANVQLMVNILKRDFSSNQIIIASIYQYNFEISNIIEIRNRLIENDGDNA